MQEDKPDVYAVIRKWNLFIDTLIEARKHWQILLEYRRNVRLDFDNLPRGAGKFFGLATSRSAFDVMLPRLLDYVRKYASLEEMIVNIDKLKESKNVQESVPESTVAQSSRSGRRR